MLRSTLIVVLGIFVAAVNAADIVKYPIVYSENYNLGISPFVDDMLQKIHPFDIKKYAKIQGHLKKVFELSDEQFYQADEVGYYDLLDVHTPEYLDSLTKASVISKGMDVGHALTILPASLLDSAILKPLRYATGGTIKAVELALDEGWAINLGGGYHHAKPNGGEGGCFYADAPLAILRARQDRPDLKVLIIDLDAHQGNGNAAFAATDDNLYIFDMYNKNEYPVYDQRPENPLYDGKRALAHVDFPLPLDGGYLGTTGFSEICDLSIPWLSVFGYTENPTPRRVDDNEYLSVLKEKLERSLASLKKRGETPDLIIYNAGSDVFLEDDLGMLNVSREGMIARDSYVWGLARDNKIPIVLILSGGYGPNNAMLVAESLEAILRREMGLLER